MHAYDRNLGVHVDVKNDTATTPNCLFSENVSITILDLNKAWLIA